MGRYAEAHPRALQAMREAVLSSCPLGADRGHCGSCVSGRGAIVKLTETAIVRACLDWLAYKGIVAWRANSGAVKASYNGKSRFVRFNSMKGMSDICAILPDGTFAAIEVKKPGGKPTAEQEEFLHKVRRTGGVGIVVHSVDELEDSLSDALCPF
jgi:hypothetical protein